MYKITVLFESDVNGVYTQEIETVQDEKMKNIKYGELLDKWLNILFPNLALIANYKEEKHLDNKHIIDCINLNLDYRNKISIKNRNRTFNIKVENNEE